MIPRKCEFLKKSLPYLGHRILEGVLKLMTLRFKVIQEWSVPKTVTEVRSFLGFINY